MLRLKTSRLWITSIGPLGVGALRELLRKTLRFIRNFPEPPTLSVPWSLRPRNRAAAATCGHGRCELPVVLRVAQKSLAASDFFAATEAKNLAISAVEWLRARLRPPWALRFRDAMFVPLSSNPWYFLKSIAGANGRRTAVQWEVYCSTNWSCTAALPCLQSFEASEAQRYKWGAYCGTNWRCTASTFQTSCTCWGLLNSLQSRLELSISNQHPHRRWEQGSGQCWPKLSRQVCLSRCPKS